MPTTPVSGLLPEADLGSVQVLRNFKTKTVTVIGAQGADREVRHSVEAHIQPRAGFFPIDTPMYEGDIVEYDDPRGGQEQKTAAVVDICDLGDEDLNHIKVTWGTAPPIQLRSVEKLQLEGLHHSVVSVAGDLFADGHYPKRSSRPSRLSTIA